MPLSWSWTLFPSSPVCVEPRPNLMIWLVSLNLTYQFRFLPHHRSGTQFTISLFCKLGTKLSGAPASTQDSEPCSGWWTNRSHVGQGKWICRSSCQLVTNTSLAGESVGSLHYQWASAYPQHLVSNQHGNDSLSQSLLVMMSFLCFLFVKANCLQLEVKQKSVSKH